jgi:hypothetical protein
MWSQFADPSDIDFRTACNQAANASDRPLTRRMLSHIARSDSAQSRLDGFAQVHAPSPAQAAGWLTAQSWWPTVVLESVAEIKAAVERERVGMKWVREWWSKRRPGQERSTAERVATILVSTVVGTTGVATAYVAVKATPLDTLLTVPIAFTHTTNEPVLSVAVKTVIDPNSTPLKIAFDASGASATLPIKLIADPGAATIKISTDQSAPLDRITKAIIGATSVLKATGTAVPELSARAEGVQHAIEGLRAFDPRAAENLGRIEAALVSSPCRAAGLENGTTQLRRIGDGLDRLTGLAATGQTITVVTAIENQPKRLAVSLPGADAKPMTCVVELEIGKIGQSVQFKKLQASCRGVKTVANSVGSAALKPVPLGELTPIGNQPIAVAVDAVTRPLFGAKSATLRLLTVPTIDMSVATSAAK